MKMIKKYKSYFTSILILFIFNFYVFMRNSENIVNDLQNSHKEMIIQSLFFYLIITVLSICLNKLGKNKKIPKKLIHPTILVTTIVCCIDLYLKVVIDKSDWMKIIAGILLIVIGNYLPKIKPSRFIGLKLNWLLDKPHIWYKTHRLAGMLWIAVGVFIIFNSFESLGWMLVYFSLLYIIPVVYSIWLCYGKKIKNESRG